jgi:hypothetical protein
MGCKSLCSYLAFDSRSIRMLLSEENEKYFDPQYPLFYKNEEGLSGLDIALQ